MTGRTLSIGLTDAQREARKNGIGGSDANVLMSGDDAAVLRLWEEKTGQREPDNLDDVLPVVMGQWTEALNIYWFERQTGRLVTNEGMSCRHDFFDFMGCNLDGLTDDGATVFEAKHVNAFSKIDDVVDRYQPQLHHNMMVCGLTRAVLSVFIGTMTWDFVEVEFDHDYADALMDREGEFWDAVLSRTPPSFLAPVAPPTPPEKWRTVSMDGHNLWAAMAGDWLQHRDGAKRFAAAEKEIKGLMEADIGVASGHGIVCKRSKNGALRISEEK